MTPKATRGDLLALAREHAPTVDVREHDFAVFGRLPLLVDRIDVLRRVWRVLADRAPESGWWPVVSNLDIDWDFFIHTKPTYDPSPGTQRPVDPYESPSHAQRVAEAFDFDGWLYEREKSFPTDPAHAGGKEWSELLTDGVAPSDELIAELLARLPTLPVLERALWDWELTVAPRSFPLPHARADWVKGRMAPCIWEEHAGLALLPVANGTQAAGYVRYWGVAEFSRDHLVAAVHRWERRYGARLWFSDTVQLGFVLPGPLPDREQAWALARESFLVEDDGFFISGTPIRVCARDLLVSDEFRLYDRP